jgi:hypothetical protein
MCLAPVGLFAFGDDRLGDLKSRRSVDRLKSTTRIRHAALDRRARTVTRRDARPRAEKRDGRQAAGRARHAGQRSRNARAMPGRAERTVRRTRIS